MALEQNSLANSQTLWVSFLDEILYSHPKHYLWLKTLSYLEYIGYRKMVKSIPYNKVNTGVYHHLTDEIQHSFMLRELAEKNFGANSLALKEVKALVKIAEDYFQRVDSQIHDWIKGQTGKEDPFLCYLCTSCVIEKRAMKVYPQYFAQLSHPSVKLVIQKIIKDESEHLAYLEEVMNYLPEADLLKELSLFDFEENCFIQLLQEMKQYFEETTC